MKITDDYREARTGQRPAGDPDQHTRYARQTRNLVLVIAVAVVLVLLFAPIW